MEKIILASASPRRKQLMELLGIPFDIVIKPIEEKLQSNLSPKEHIQNLAFKKAHAVALDYPNDLVIGCDTMVVVEELPLGKPKNAIEAKHILKMLSGKEHYVCTGVALLCKQSNIEVCFTETTFVKMKHLSHEEIEEYVETGESLDKAGAYAIQGKAAIYIEKISGDYYNVVGLPIHRLYETLIQLNRYPRKKQVKL